jgi:hypothetical protein
VWDDQNPVHFVGHSAGVQVVRVLHQMLADKVRTGDLQFLFKSYCCLLLGGSVLTLIISFHFGIVSISVLDKSTFVGTQQSVFSMEKPFLVCLFCPLLTLPT